MDSLLFVDSISNWQRFILFFLWLIQSIIRTKGINASVLAPEHSFCVLLCCPTLCSVFCYLIYWLNKRNKCILSPWQCWATFLASHTVLLCIPCLWYYKQQVCWLYLLLMYMICASMDHGHKKNSNIQPIIHIMQTHKITIIEWMPKYLRFNKFYLCSLHQLIKCNIHARTHTSAIFLCDRKQVCDRAHMRTYVPNTYHLKQA